MALMSIGIVALSMVSVLAQLSRQFKKVQG